MFQSVFEAVRKKKPLIHSITNYVTANDCANLLLACGASPIMADDPAEAEEVAAGCDGLVLNLGTLNRQRLDAMLLAGNVSNALCHPVVSGRRRCFPVSDRSGADAFIQTSFFCHTGKSVRNQSSDYGKLLFQRCRCRI